jgi:hypothetical protein
MNEPTKLQSVGCNLGCTTECKAKLHGVASECPALPWQPPAVTEPIKLPPIPDGTTGWYTMHNEQIKQWGRLAVEQATANLRRDLLDAANDKAEMQHEINMHYDDGFWRGVESRDDEVEALKDKLAAANAEVEALRAALTDMYAGWKYIRSFHGDLYGVGWDRCDEKARAALTKEQP